MNTHQKKTTKEQPFDGMLYATSTQKLREIAEQEGATKLIGRTTTEVFTVVGEKFTDERDMYIFAIERNRKAKEKGGRAK